MELYRPELREDSQKTQTVFRTGNEIGEIAQRLYDPNKNAQTIDLKKDGLAAALTRTRSLLTSRQPIFEAGLATDDIVVFADLMLPETSANEQGWRIVEVKSSTSVKSYQEEDIAIQCHVARECGVPLKSVSIAHIDSTWIYPGGGDYRGLLTEVDLTQSAFSRQSEVKTWIAEAQAVAEQSVAPEVFMGEQCRRPFQCGFVSACSKGQAQAEFPIAWLPRIQAKKLKAFIEERSVLDIREIPEHLLNGLQRRVRDATLSGRIYFDQAGAKKVLSPYTLPAYFLDFETIQFGVPRWAGTRPFQMLPFQFSVHRLNSLGHLSVDGFLDLSGNDPSEAFAHALIRACPEPIPVFVYNAGFEGGRLSELAQRFVRFREPLLEMRARLVDLYPIAQQHYYHPSQKGSWSIKKILPTVAPLDYEALVQVQDGGAAMQAYLEAINPVTNKERRAEIEDQLISYCRLDTLAMVELWKYLSGNFS